MSFSLAEDPAEDMLGRTVHLPRAMWVRLVRCYRESRSMEHITLDGMIRDAIEGGLPALEAAHLPSQRRKPKKPRKARS